MFFAQFPMWQFMVFSNQAFSASSDVLLTYQADLWNQGKNQEANDIFVPTLVAGYGNYMRWHPELKKRDQEAMQRAVEAIETYIAKWPSSKCLSEPEDKRLDCELTKEGHRTQKAIGILESKLNEQQ